MRYYTLFHRTRQIKPAFGHYPHTPAKTHSTPCCLPVADKACGHSRPSSHQYCRAAPKSLASDFCAKSGYPASARRLGRHDARPPRARRAIGRAAAWVSRPKIRPSCPVARSGGPAAVGNEAIYPSVNGMATTTRGDSAHQSWCTAICVGIPGRALTIRGATTRPWRGPVSTAFCLAQCGGL